MSANPVGKSASATRRCWPQLQRADETLRASKWHLHNGQPIMRSASVGSVFSEYGSFKFSRRVVACTVFVVVFTSGIYQQHSVLKTERLSQVPVQKSAQKFCTSKELSSGYWTNDSTWELNSSCLFLQLESDEVRRCLKDTDFLIGGHSVSRAIHFELLEYLNYTSNYVDRITQKAKCDIPFTEMFDTHTRLYDEMDCSAAEEGHPAAHFFWLVDWSTVELEKFYARALDDAEKNGRRLLISVNVMTNRCYPTFELESEQCLPLMRKTFPRLIEIIQNLLHESEPKHTFTYRTNTHVLDSRPEELPAVLMNDYIVNQRVLEQNGFSLLRLGDVTAGPGRVHYLDSIHPDRYLTRLFLRMLIHLHCSVELHSL